MTPPETTEPASTEGPASKPLPPAATEPKPDEGTPAKASQPGDSVATQREHRATVEDYVLWAVITAVLVYFGWYLSSATSTLERAVDVERLAVYGMNIRADLVLVIGAALALLGCMIVLRRVRTGFSGEGGTGQLKMRIVADSAGVVIVLAAVILLGIVVTHPSHYERGGSPTDNGSNSAGETKHTTLEERMNEVREQQKHDTGSNAGSGQ